MDLLDDPISIYATPDPRSITPDDTMGYALLRMINHRFRRLPITDNQGNLKGIITSSDILQALSKTKSISFLKQNVSDFMTTSVVSVEAGESLKNTIFIMKDKNVSCVPITNDGELVGIFTNKDLLLIHQIWRDIPKIDLSAESSILEPITDEIKIQEQSTILTAIDTLASTKFKLLLVFNGQDECVGMVPIMRILRSVASHLITEQMSAEFLSTEVINSVIQEALLHKCIPTSLDDIRNFMNSRGVEAVPICQKEAHNITHVITERDMKNIIASYIS